MSTETTPAAPAAPETPTPPPVTPPPAAPETPPTPPPAAPPAEEKPDIVDAMLTSIRKKPAAKKDATPPAEPPPAAPTPPAEPPPVTPPPAPAPEPEKPKRPRTPKPPPPPTLSAEDAARIAAEAVKAAMPQPQPVLDEDVPEDLRRNEPVYAELEKMYPDKYKGVMRKLANFRKAEVARADAWEAANPGKPYNADDPDHADWYAKNQPRIEADDLDEARFELRYKKRLERDVDPKLKEAEKTIARMRAEPQAEVAAQACGRTIFEALDPKTVESKQSFDTWAAANPVVAEVAREVAAPVGEAVKAASLLWDGVVEFAQNDPSHVEAKRFFDAFESELHGSEEPVVDKSGRRWVPVAEFTKLPAQRRAEFFTTTKEALVRYIGLTVADKVKSIAQERLAFVEKYAQKMGFFKGNPAPAAPSAPSLGQTPPPPAPSRPAPLPASPSVGAGEGTGPSVGTTPPSSTEPKDLSSRFLGL